MTSISSAIRKGTPPNLNEEVNFKYGYLRLRVQRGSEEITSSTARCIGKSTCDVNKTGGLNIPPSNFNSSDQWFPIKEIKELTSRIPNGKLLTIGTDYCGAEILILRKLLSGYVFNVLDLNPLVLNELDASIDNLNKMLDESSSFKPNSIGAYIGTALDLPFEDSTLDLVFHSSVFDADEYGFNSFTPEQLERASSEIDRVLIPGGIEVSFYYHLVSKNRSVIFSNDICQASKKKS